MKRRIYGLLLALVLLVSLLPAAVNAQPEEDSGEIRLPGFSFGESAEEGTEPSNEDTTPVEETTKPSEETKSPAKETAEKTPEATTEPVTQPATEPAEKTPDPTEEAVDHTEPEVLSNGERGETFPWEIVLTAAAAAAILAGVAMLIRKRKS